MVCHMFDRKRAVMRFKRSSFRKGSFTIEAVIWVPVLAGLMLAVLQEGITFYEKCVHRECYEELRSWDGVSRFYELWALKELEEGIEDE